MKMAKPVYLCSFLLLSMMCESVAVCPEACSCSQDTIVCESYLDIPDGPPRHVTNVTFQKVITNDRICRGYFSSGNWANVTSLKMNIIRFNIWDHVLLSIIASLEQDSYEYNRSNYEIQSEGCFTGLEKLQYLGLSLQYSLDKYSLDYRYIRGISSLSSLKTIDFTGSPYLTVVDVIEALNPESQQQNILPSLENITLKGLTGLYDRYFNADSFFFDGLYGGGRIIKYLDLSYTRIRFVFISDFYRLCHAIESLILLDTEVNIIIFAENGTCQSLRTLDISGARLCFGIERGRESSIIEFDEHGKCPRSRTLDLREARKSGLIYDILDCRWMRIADELENLYASGMNKLPRDPVILLNDTDLSKCLGRLKTVVAQNNSLSLVNFTIHLNRQTVQSFRELDLSNNVIEYFSPATLSVFKFLQILNLANNRLHRMQQHFPGEFESLFRGNTELHNLNLAHNELTHITTTLLIMNVKLETIDLSDNKLTSISIELSSLAELHFLDLSQNHLTTLDTEFLSQLDYLGNGEFRANLSWNEYICECDDNSQHFVNWLKDSRFLSDIDHTGFNCYLDGEINNIVNVSLSNICRVKALRRKLVIAAITVFVTIVLAVIISFTSRRVYLRRLRRGNVLRELENGDFPKQFLVFLSYASEDATFVHTNIYNQLEEALAKIAPNNRFNVCIGDRDFRVGTHVQTEVVRCMEKSAVVMFVTSNSFCRKGWCLMEVNEAYDQHKPIIILMRERVETGVMPLLLRRIFNKFTHAAWVEDEEGGHIEPRMDILCESILQLLCDEYDYQQEMETPV